MLVFRDLWLANLHVLPFVVWDHGEGPLPNIVSHGMIVKEEPWKKLLLRIGSGTS